MELTEQLREYSQKLQQLSEELAAGIHALVRNDLPAVADLVVSQAAACEAVKSAQTSEFMQWVGRQTHSEFEKACLTEIEDLQKTVAQQNRIYSSLLRKSRNYTNTLIALRQSFSTSASTASDPANGYPGNPSIAAAHSICEV